MLECRYYTNPVEYALTEPGVITAQMHCAYSARATFVDKQ